MWRYVFQHIYPQVWHLYKTYFYNSCLQSQPITSPSRSVSSILGPQVMMCKWHLWGTNCCLRCNLCSFTLFCQPSKFFFMVHVKLLGTSHNQSLSHTIFPVKRVHNLTFSPFSFMLSLLLSWQSSTLWSMGQFGNICQNFKCVYPWTQFHFYILTHVWAFL